MDAWRAEWSERKRDIALQLWRGQCGGSYGEAAIILCAAISAIAVEVWPGTGIDRARFVELLKTFAPTSLGVTRISVPLLAAHLLEKKQLPASQILRERFLDYCSSRILDGADVDQAEPEIVAAIPETSLQDIRRCSYANLLYTEVRSAYAHQYRPSARADSWAMGSTPRDGVSYNNAFVWPESEIDGESEIERKIYFDIQWIGAVAIGVARQVDILDGSLPLDTPKWWVYGQPVTQ